MMDNDKILSMECEIWCYDHKESRDTCDCNPLEDEPCATGCICWGCLKDHRDNGCNYGVPCGPDDWENCCDCERL